MKEHKKQILAALALAFALGAVAPTAVFASDGTTGAGTNAGEVSSSYAENIAKLYNKIQKDGSFAGYRAAVPMIQAVIAMQEYTQSAQTVLSKVDGLGNGQTLWGSLRDETRTKLAGKNGVESIDVLKASEDYTNATLKNQIDSLSTNITAAKTALASSVKTYYATDPGVDNMSVADLIAAAQSVNGYGNYLGLYNAMKFTNGWVTSGTDLTAEVVNQKLQSEAMQATGYSDLATAAVKVSPTALDGLVQLPNTGKPSDDDDKKPSDNKPTENKPSTPNTGIVGLFESGALDLGMITLIVSVGLASAAGLALIAKLYLKHKF